MTTRAHPVMLTKDEQDFLLKSIRHLSADDMVPVVQIIREATGAEDEDAMNINVLELDPHVQRKLLTFVLKVSRGVLVAAAGRA